MSMYNMMNGINPATFLIFPMLGYGHPEDGKFPRFRDCFVSKDKKHIEVYTRMGGGNRECYENIPEGKECNCWACTAHKIEKSEGCVSRVDDDFDCTYCTFTFKVPKKWQKDFDLIIAGKLKEISEEYKQLILGLLKKEETKENLKALLYSR